MEVSKMELKILIKEFLTSSNRVLKADYLTYDSELKKFVFFIESKPLIADYIMSCGKPEYDVKTEVEKVANSYGNSIFSLGETAEKEVANIYAVIKYLAENNYSGRSYVYYGYSSSKKFQDKVNAFGEKFIRILVTHIEGYLSTLTIKMGYDESTTIQLNFDNGNFQNSQINLATTGGIVNATQNNNPLLELDELIEKVRNTAKEIPKEDLEVVNDCIEVIETLKDSNPKRSIIRVALKTLQGIAGTTEFLAAVTEVVEFVQNYMLGLS